MAAITTQYSRVKEDISTPSISNYKSFHKNFGESKHLKFD
jgi:hypothetical protein